MTLKNIMTLKTRLGLTQDHGRLHHSLHRMRVPTGVIQYGNYGLLCIVSGIKQYMCKCQKIANLCI